jgi:hypothetical protein
MSIEESIRARIGQLLSQSTSLSGGDENGQCTSTRQLEECAAWLVSAQNAVRLVCESPINPYRVKSDELGSKEHGWAINDAVGVMAAILRSLLVDADYGLLSSIADRAQAEAFDNFLDHAHAYLSAGSKNDAGVIAGVVFEDTFRRICRKSNIVEKGIKLDSLISELSSRGDLSAIKAKRARAAAHVRTKASHAQWDEFGLEDVEAAIVFTRELIESKLDR